MVTVAVFTLTSLTFFRVALLPEFGAELGASALQLGAVTTIFGVGRLLADLPGGHLADRFAVRGLMAWSALGVAVGSVVFASAGSLMPIYVASLVLGVASSTTNATGMTFFAHFGGADHRGTSMAIFSGSLLGGQALGPAAAGVIAGAAGWRIAMVVAAVVAVCLTFALVMSKRAKPIDSAGPSRRVGGRPGAGITRLSMLILQSVSFAVFLTLGAVPQTLVPVIGSTELGLGATAIGLALGVGGFSRFVGTMIGGRISDRLSRKSALVPALLIQAGGVALLVMRPSVVLWVASLVVMSLASFAVPVAATMLGDLSDPARVGAQLGRFRFAGDLGLILGPISVSALYGGIGREAAFASVAALLALVALAAWRLLPETRRCLVP